MLELELELVLQILHLVFSIGVLERMRRSDMGAGVLRNGAL